jgi:hypothetical protein
LYRWVLTAQHSITARYDMDVPLTLLLHGLTQAEQEDTMRDASELVAQPLMKGKGAQKA